MKFQKDVENQEFRGRYLKVVWFCVTFPLLYSYALNQKSPILICLLNYHHRRNWWAMAGRGIPCLLVQSHRPPKEHFESCLLVFHRCIVRCPVLSDYILLGTKIYLNNNSCFLLEEKKKHSSQITFFYTTLQFEWWSAVLKNCRVQVPRKEAPALVIWEHRHHQGTGWQICLEMPSSSHPINKLKNPTWILKWNYACDCLPLSSIFWCFKRT